ncbi:MAG: hypothetical protein ACMXYG_03220 [Candidatus Woesearchaeota archaeon]
MNKKVLKKLFKGLSFKITFKLVLYIIITIIIVLSLMGFSYLLRAALGIYLIHRLFVLASHGWTCPTCLAKLFIALFVFVLIFIGTATQALVLLLGLIWFDYFFLKRD